MSRKKKQQPLSFFCAQNWRIIESDDQYLHPSESLGNQIEINENGYWAL